MSKTKWLQNKVPPRLTRIGRLLLLAVVDDLILVGHLHVLILLHVVAVMRKEGRWFNVCAVIAVKKRGETVRERKNEGEHGFSLLARPWSRNDE